MDTTYSRKSLGAYSQPPTIPQDVEALRVALNDATGWESGHLYEAAVLIARLNREGWVLVPTKELDELREAADAAIDLAAEAIAS